MSAITKKDEALPEVREDSVLLEMVKRTDIDPDRLEKFMDLQFKMEAKQAERSFNQALAGFQGECPIIPKNKKVDFTARSGKQTTYNYSPIEEMVGKIRPLLTKYNLSFSFDVREAEEKEKMILVTKIRHASGHSEDTTYFFNKYHDDDRMNLSQRAKSSITFAKRAALENALGLVTEKEEDADQRTLLPEVTSKQIDEIRALIKETNSNEAKFLAFIKAESLDSLTPEQAQKAIHALKQKGKANV